MANNKLFRTNDDIRFAVSQLLPRVKDPRVSGAGMLSVTHVDTTGDLKYCKIFVSAYGCNDEKGLMKGLKSASPWIRHELMGSLKLRYTPELIFELDKSLEYGAHINTLITNVMKNEPKSEDSEVCEGSDELTD